MRDQSLTHWNGRLILPENDAAPPPNPSPADWQNYRSGSEELLNCSMENYVSCIDQFENGYFDVIIVDGRARPSCLFHAWQKLKPNGLLFLDNAEVDYYSPICQILGKNCAEYFAFPGAGPYIPRFWLTCAWRRPRVMAELQTNCSTTARTGNCE